MLRIYFAFFGFSAISTRRRSDSMTPFGLFAGAQIAVARREGIEGVPTVIPVGDFESLEPEGDRLFRFELDLLCRLRGSFDAQLWRRF
jgi:hypothetical protein